MQGVSRQVVLATQNKDKLRKLRLLMKGARVRVLSLSDFPKMPKVREDGKTFEANAEKKARVYSSKTKALVIADDSGLEVKALGGAPGVYSARYAGAGCSYSDNNRKLLGALRSTAWPKRLAKFVSVISVYDNGRKIGTVRGECAGRIGFLEKGENGFGYDPVFIPKNTGKTYAELTAAQKGKISHRGKALRKAKKILLKYLE